MHSQILAARNAEAQRRILDAARRLAERAGLTGEVESLEEARHREPAIAILRQREAIADFLEKLADGSLLVGTNEETKTPDDDPQPAVEVIVEGPQLTPAKPAKLKRN